MKPFLSFRRLFAVCFMLLALPVLAQSGQGLGREAARTGDIMPMELVLQRAQKVAPGKVLEVELERKRGTSVYAIKLLRDNGTVSKLYFDAWDGALLDNRRQQAKKKHDWVREAVRAGEIMPLELIVRQVEKAALGRILEIELERERGMWVYEVKLLRDNGALSKLYFDARDGYLLDGRQQRDRRDEEYQEDY
ncbi:MAG: PepSY domain-containing protein [Betaproteobacteria bacterium]|nr:PepSY domain-containing protein [Betaproteobacteria bacterium]